MHVKNNLWYGDLHIHTNLSFCSPQEIVPESYLPLIEGEELSVLGFANHLYSKSWLNDAKGEYPGVERVLQIRPQLEEMKKKTKARILLGCEVETFIDQEPTLPRCYAGEFDYILLAASHIVNVSKEYTKYDIYHPDSLRDILIERFLYVCHLDYNVPTGICHPLYPICSSFEQEVVDGISDSVLSDCFSTAAKHNLSIEIHACLFRGGTRLNSNGISPSYLRILSAALSCGCHFHFGVDAHTSEAFKGKHAILKNAASSIGITEDNMWNFPGLC